MNLNDSTESERLRRDLEDLEDFPSWPKDKASEMGKKFDHAVETKESKAVRIPKKMLTKIRTEADQMAQNEIKNIEVASDDAVEGFKDAERDIIDEAQGSPHQRNHKRDQQKRPPRRAAQSRKAEAFAHFQFLATTSARSTTRWL